MKRINSKTFIYYQVCLFVLFVIHFFIPETLISFYLFSVCAYALLPFFFIFISSRNRLFYIVNFFSLSCFYILLLVSFKKLRFFFPPTQISQEKIVGFAQYNAYPFYFDTFVFFLFVSVTFLMPFILKKYFRK